MSRSELPRTRKEMKRANYALIASKPCKDCEARIEIWKTTHGKFLAFDPATRQVNPDEEMTQLHRCQAKSAVTHRREFTLEEEQARAMELLSTQLQARALVAVLQDGRYLYSAKLGIAPEDLRHDLITAANNMKRELEAQHG